MNSPTWPYHGAVNSPAWLGWRFTGIWEGTGAAPPQQRNRPYRPRRTHAMNLQALEPLTANGSPQAVSVPRGYQLIVHPIGQEAQISQAATGTARITAPADQWCYLGESLGQTLYITAAAGTVIELALT